MLESNQLLLEAFLEQLLAKGLSRNTVSSYNSDMSEFFNKLNSDIIKLTIESKHENVIQKYLIQLKKKSANSTVARKISSFKAFFNFLSENDLITKESIPYLESPKTVRTLPLVLTAEELNRLLAVHENKEDLLSIRNSLILELLYATGLRVSELTNLTFRDIDLREKDGYLEIGEFLTVKGKNDTERLIPIHEIAKEKLQTYLSARELAIPRRSTWRQDRFTFLNWVFVEESKDFTNQKPLTRQRVGQILKETAALAGLNVARISPHKIRHSFASHLLQNGTDMRIIQGLLGHSSILTTEIYTHVKDKELIEVVKNSHPLSNGKFS